LPFVGGEKKKIQDEEIQWLLIFRTTRIISFLLAGLWEEAVL
jgi:hypothetical protein